MKKDDRIQDKAMEKLVANKLHGQLQPQAAGCPEAETLAAYVDGTLAARERRQWEDHFSTCSRCQEQVATLVRWSEEDEPLERKVVVARPRAFAGFRWAWAAPVLLAVFVAGLWYTGEFRSRLRQTQETSLETPRSGPAPATPAASQVQSLPGTSAVKGEVAETRKAGMPSENKRLQPLPPTPANEVDSLKDQEVRRDFSLEGRNTHTLAKLVAPAPSNIPEVTAKTESTPVEPAVGVAPVPMPKPNDRAWIGAAGTMSERGAAEDIRTREATGGGRGGGGAASSLGTAAVSQVAGQAGAALPPAPGTAGAMKEKKAEVSKQRIATNLAQEASLLPRAKGWRVGPHGLIQKTDARGNWVTVPSGVDADLFDISSPVPNVGWAVGQTGLALRTTDGGETWSRIPTPTREDLIKVSARTELAAQIETRNHQVWETTDGGESWRRFRPE